MIGQKRQTILGSMMLITSYIVLVVVWALYVSDFRNGDFTKYDLINVIVFICMAILMVISIVHLSKIRMVANDLIEASRSVEGFANTNDIDIPELWSVFRNDKLRNLYAKFKAERNRISAQYPESGMCDIREFFSEKNLDDYYRVDILNQISGAMTGLGMLGTFIGLTMGISSVDNVSSNISPLLSSIQVAFYTSIAGLALSIIFNFVYRSALNLSYDVLGAFDDLFDSITGNIEYDGVNSMVTSVKGFSLDISNQIGCAVKQELESMEETYLLGCEEIKSATSNALDSFIEKFSDSFMGRLNEAVDGLCSAVKDTTEYQLKSNEELKKNIEAISKLSGFTKTINEITTRLEGFITQLNENTLSLIKQVEQNQISVQQASDNAHQLTELARSLDEHIINFREIAGEMQTTVDGFNAGTDDVVTRLDELSSEIQNTYNITVQNIMQQHTNDLKMVLSEASNKTCELTSSLETTYKSVMNSIQQSTSQITSISQQERKELESSYLNAATSITKATEEFSYVAQQEKNEREITQERLVNIIRERSDQIDVDTKMLASKIDNLQRIMDR